MTHSDVLAGGPAWLADVFDTAAVEHLIFKSAENIAAMRPTPIPYELGLTGAKAHWKLSQRSLPLREETQALWRAIRLLTV